MGADASMASPGWVLAFVNTDARDEMLVAAFQQNSLQLVNSGEGAEVAFDSVPGRVFKGTVVRVLDAIAAGQVQPTGTLIDVDERTSGVVPWRSSASPK